MDFQSRPMITFYPGPSKVYPQVEQYLSDAWQAGILSANHRSEAFMEMLRHTLEEVRQKLAIPADYEIYLVSSATECWEIIAQSLTSKAGFHIYNGAFGEKWMEYATKIRPATQGVSFDLQSEPQVSLLDQMPADAEVICLTHNETSNGTMLPVSFMRALRAQTTQLIAVDAVSSMGGVEFEWSLADVWYASVQKCFGLPPGLGVVVVSPAAVAKARELADNRYYNSLLFLRDNFLKFQTPYTPNTLGIYLLGRVAEHIPVIQETAEKTVQRGITCYQFLEENGYKTLIGNPAVRSATVMAVETDSATLRALRKDALDAGIVLGNGYGPWKERTFRIANFPAVSDDDFLALRSFLSLRARSRQ